MPLTGGLSLRILYFTFKMSVVLIADYLLMVSPKQRLIIYTLALLNHQKHFGYTNALVTQRCELWLFVHADHEKGGSMTTFCKTYLTGVNLALSWELYHESLQIQADKNHDSAITHLSSGGGERKSFTKQRSISKAKTKSSLPCKHFSFTYSRNVK